MEVVLSVPEAELEDFPEEATESSGQQKQPSESSQTQGRLKACYQLKSFPWLICWKGLDRVDYPIWIWMGLLYS